MLVSWSREHKSLVCWCAPAICLFTYDQRPYSLMEVMKSHLSLFHNQVPAQQKKKFAIAWGFFLSNLLHHKCLLFAYLVMWVPWQTVVILNLFFFLLVHINRACFSFVLFTVMILEDEIHLSSCWENSTQKPDTNYDHYCICIYFYSELFS